MKKRKLLKIAITLIAILALFIHFYVPRFITEIRNPLIEIVRGGNSKTISPKFEIENTNGKYLNFETFDGLKISSYITYSDHENPKGTVILLHGIRSKKEHFISLSQKLANQGYNSVAIDHRAHGESEGTHCTFGVKEKKDISKLLDVLEKEEKITENIGVWGQSLGGAIGLQAMGNDPRIKFGIIESTFTDFETIVHDYFQYHLGFKDELLTDYLVSRAGDIAEFDEEDAKPMKYCKNINQPILLIHGDEDKRINIKYGKENFSNIISSKKEFLKVDGANHLNVWKVGGEAYFEKVFSFLEYKKFKDE
ncbi:alpha/beta hydrolase [Aureivirga sp. CE67]|uniref:alpha/beta hydrolase n=1 Tax=Aureivirga sp. CE67 TaxID=1788983 RepID=UPI0018CB7844|nr:alpha/beta fold hydrolase [Aureivirga sp. CE67]